MVREGNIDPPEVIDAPPMTLRRAVVSDAVELAAAASSSREHLAPWMPWATPEGVTVEAQVKRLANASWGLAEYGYLMISPEGTIVGGCGLHRRADPGAVEIGYWVHVGHTKRGFATAAAAALTETALSLSGISRVEIHCDKANIGSASVARRLGYGLDRVEEHPIEAPAHTGQFLIWVKT